MILVTGIHEEATEDDVLDKFADYGSVRSIQVNLDRHTGFNKGYGILEYGGRAEAEAAIARMDGQELMGKQVRVAWAFVQGEEHHHHRGGRGGGRGGRRR